MNVKLDEKLLREVEKLVKSGYVKTRKEAFERALQMLVKSHKALEFTERIDRVREGTEAMPSVTEAVTRSHEEEEG